MKNKLALAVCFAAAFLVGLVILLPASVFGSVAERLSGGRFVLEATSGTVWKGEGDLALRFGSSAPVALGRVAWSLSALRLLTARVHLALRQEYEGRHGAGMVTAGFSAVEIADADLLAPAGLLAAASPALSVLGPSGDLRVRTRALTWSKDGRIDGDASVDWDPALLLEGTTAGAYRLALRGDGGNLTGNLQTLRGPLRLDGTGSWAATQPLRLQAKVRFDGEANAPVGQLYKLLCPRGGNECLLNFGA